MSLRINTNTASLWARDQLHKSSQSLTASLEKLSSGRRINKAADDSSGMVIANRLASQARGFGQAIRNANDAISVVQVADGALSGATEILQELRVKALQAANDGQSLESRKALQADIDRSLESLDDIAQNTSFNGQKLLSGAFTNKSFQVGASANQTVNLSIGSAETDKLGDPETGQLSDINVLTQEGAQAAIETIDAALQQINTERAEMGSTQNQLSSAINNLSVSEVNTRSAESMIADVDFAEESMNLSKLKILTKARAFAMAQANSANEKNFMSLLQGD